LIVINENVTIPEEEIRETFIRSSGPGGQNVNKVATAVQLRFDVAASPSLTEDVKTRLTLLAGKRMTKEGILIIEARRFRTQEQNREDARERLIDLVRLALVRPKIRKKTRLPRVAKEKRLEEKKRRSDIKKQRRTIPPKDWI
jgi:ribosome-associated protein